MTMKPKTFASAPCVNFRVGIGRFGAFLHSNLGLSYQIPKKQAFRERGRFRFSAMGRICEEMKKPRVLCLHGFRTSAEIMKKQLGKWPDSVLGELDLIFLDAPFPASGISDVETLEYKNFDECLTYVEDFMLNQGPFDGLLGFSQGAILSAALSSMQTKGLALTRVPKLNFLIIIGGGMFRSPTLCEKVYSSPIHCLSVHFIGDADFLQPRGEMLLELFVEPIVIRHPKGHIIPNLDGENLATMINFVRKIQRVLSCGASASSDENDALLE